MGAIDHMVCSISFLTIITTIISKSVKLPDGQFAFVTHVETVKISASLTLTILCVPFFFLSILYQQVN